MLRWLIIILFLANLLAFGFASGMLGRLPASGPLEPGHLNRQVHPEWLQAHPITAADAGEQAVVGRPAPEPMVAATPLVQ